MIKRILSFILLFLYIFNVIPPIGPSKIGTRIYIGIIGFFFLICSSYVKKNSVIKLLSLNLLFVFFSLLTVLINNTTDFWYVQFALLNVVYISGALFLVYLFAPSLKSLYNWIEYIIYCILLNSLVAFIGFVYHPIMLFITSIQKLGNESLIEGIFDWNVRALGFGSGNFFWGGVINGFGLIFIFYLISINYFSMKKGIILLGLLSLTGMFIARTTIIGLFLGFLLFLYKANIKNGITFLLLIIGITSLLLIVNPLEGINTSWALGFINTIISEGHTADQSLGVLDEMWKIEMSVNTLLFGDGLSKYADGSYYMHTDVGYLRNVLYFGIIGTVLGYFLFYLLVCKRIIKEAIYKYNIKILIYMLYLFLLIVNYKGLPDYSFMLFLIIAYFIVDKNKHSFKYEHS